MPDPLEPGTLVRVADGHAWAGITAEVDAVFGTVVCVRHNNDLLYVNASDLVELF